MRYKGGGGGYRPIFIMINITLYKFSKKNNSTKIPDNSTTKVTYQCTISESCSITSPVVIIENVSTMTYLGSYNYAYIPTFERYYFVTDVVFDANTGFWNFHLTVDVLASVKTSLIASSQYVERAYNYTGSSISDWDNLNFNPYMIDSSYQSELKPVYDTTKYASPFQSLPQVYGSTLAPETNGWYILGIVSSNNIQNKFGGVTYYLMTSYQLRQFIYYMLGGIAQWFDLSTLASGSMNAELLGLIGEPLQYIVSCKFIPRVPKIIVDSLGNPEHIWFGMYETNYEAYLMPLTYYNNPMVSFGVSIPLTDHPQVTRGKWLNGNTHTERVVRFEPFGVIPLDSSKFIGYSRVMLSVDYDIITGKGILNIYATNDNTYTAISDYASGTIENLTESGGGVSYKFITSLTSNLLIDFPLTQFTHRGAGEMFLNDFLRPMSNSALNVFNGAFSGGKAGAIQAGVNSAVEQSWTTIDGLNSFFNAPSCQGTSGSLVCHTTQIRLTNKFSLLVPERRIEIGRPICRNLPLTDFTGFVKCFGGHFETDKLTNIELERVNTLINSGFYIE